MAWCERECQIAPHINKRVVTLRLVVGYLIKKEYILNHDDPSLSLIMLLMTYFMGTKEKKSVIIENNSCRLSAMISNSLKIIKWNKNVFTSYLISQQTQ